MLKKMTPNLIVDDVNATIEWYQDVLGCSKSSPHRPWRQEKYDWAMMACEDVEIMFQSKESIKKSIKDFDRSDKGCTAVMYRDNILRDLEQDKGQGRHNKRPTHHLIRHPGAGYKRL